MRTYLSNRRALCLLMLLVLFGSLSGCGGGSGTSGSGTKLTGKAVFTIHWPARASRLIPADANFINLVVTQGTFTNTMLIPTSETTVSVDLPPGDVTATATAYHANTGLNTVANEPQATGSVTFTVFADSTTDVTLTMQSTIKSIVLSSPGLTFPLPDNTLVVKFGTPVSVTATPVDANGNPVPVLASNLVWTTGTGSSSFVTVTGSPGTTVNVASSSNGGTTTLTVTEQESGVQATVEVDAGGG